MPEPRVQRRLAALMVADLVGFSRMMSRDEAGTIAAVRAVWDQCLRPAVAAHAGRIVKTMGDGALAEFASAVDAVACAVFVQNLMSERNANRTGEEGPALRIGINLGDIVVDGDDILGDGVNIAARLEGMAPPGGIVVSETVRAHVGNRLALDFEDLGEQVLKNIPAPVRVYRVLGGAAARSAAPRAAPKRAEPPSIAVLPFDNMSGDPGQEYFSDGLTEDIITELSRFPGLKVVSRNSTFTFKGQATDVAEVRRRLGARYVVEGSVRRSENRIRVTAQLIEATSGNHVWAQRYDRDLKDIFDLQDELVQAIAGAIPGQLDRHAVAELRRAPPDNLTAYDCELRGRWALTHWSEGLEIALDWYGKAAAADPGYAPAHAGLAMTYSYGVYVMGLPAEQALPKAREHARRAIALDDHNPLVNAHAAFVYHLAGDHVLARKHSARAVALNPNDPLIMYVEASTRLYAGGDPVSALDWFMRSERIEAYTSDDYRLDTLSDCHYTLGDYRKVMEIHEGHRLPAYLKLVLAAAAAQAGETALASAAIAEYERARPAGHDAATMVRNQMNMFARTEHRELWLAGYRRAGIGV
ncbi:MAG: adenylate/guanylate cyclase domain-containing protein [Paracoccaceae bacterium]